MTEEDYVTRLLLLAADAQFLQQMSNDGALTLECAIQPILDVVLSVNTHAYMSTDKADRAISMLALLVKESEPLQGEH